MLGYRTILHLMMFSGFVIKCTLMTNLSIAVVEMSKPLNQTKTPTLSISEKNNLLGAIFLGMLITQLLCAGKSEIYGPRKVLFIGMFFTSILTLLTPAAYYIHLFLAVLIRFILGLFIGLLDPVIMPLALTWFPSNSQSKFMSNTSAFCLGIVLSMQVFGYLTFYLGWESVFYTSGVVGVLYTVAVYYLVYDSPSEHPRISLVDKLELEDEINESGGMVRPKKVPWTKILTSGKVWIGIIVYSCCTCNIGLLLTQLPTFMHDILQFDLQANGVLSSLPPLGFYITSLVSSQLADYMTKTRKISKKTTRKIFASLTTIGSAILYILLIFLGYNTIWCITLFIMSASITGTNSAGAICYFLDIAPNFSGTIIGIGAALASTLTFLSTEFVTIFLENNNTFEGWCQMFWTIAGINLFGGVMFVSFADCEVVAWNSVEEQKNKIDTEESEVRK